MELIVLYYQMSVHQLVILIIIGMELLVQCVGGHVVLGLGVYLAHHVLLVIVLLVTHVLDIRYLNALVIVEKLIRTVVRLDARLVQIFGYVRLVI